METMGTFSPALVIPTAQTPPFVVPNAMDGQKRLAITQQTCLVEEKFSKNGIQKNVHVVVKNNPFLLTLQLLDKSITFHQLSTEVQLVYDCQSLKEVDFVKLKPLEVKTRPNEEGDQLTVELRIKVLTSQLEDMFFRVKVKLVDPRTRKEYPQYIAVTDPIRVVSKPDQVRKKVKKRKRAPTDSLMDTLQRLEQQQREQQQMIKKLCHCTMNASNPGSSLNSSLTGLKTKSENNEENGNNNNNGDSSGTEGKPEAPSNHSNTHRDEFQQAFMDFISAFKLLQTQENSDGNSAKINTSATDAQTMGEVLDIVRTELKRTRGGSPNTEKHANGSSPCACSVCPYKERMDKINSSFQEYLYSACDSVDMSHSTPALIPTPAFSSPPSYLNTPSISGTPHNMSNLTSASSTPSGATPSLIPSSTCSTSTGGSLSMEYHDDDTFLCGDNDSLSNFLNFGGITGFDSFSSFDLYPSHLSVLSPPL
eukprot:TRINITY_DN4784_c0_g1_i1.p1 TRINITY_DN4784_c0_g1~~TRINITY_DN4784_c0_g1_i1.p1  ORF type:complete len:479 (+),score=109.69 TRINITY_DN4784_c0_g1_i1:534-1970(+)